MVALLSVIYPPTNHHHMPHRSPLTSAPATPLIYATCLKEYGVLIVFRIDTY